MNIKWDAVRLGIFVLVGALAFGLLYLTVERKTLGPTSTYRAEMRDVSGLSEGDLVKVAGVRVGQVDRVELVDDNRIEVVFEVGRDQELTDATQVFIRYEDLLGNRFVELKQPPGEGRALSPGATIPAEMTTPALDLDVLLNGFRPLFRGLDANALNELASNLIATLQGQGGTLRSLLTQAAELTHGLADDRDTITSLIDNMNSLLGALDSRDAQLRQSIGRFRDLVSGLADDREPITESVVEISRMAGELRDLFVDAREPFRSTVIAVDDLAGLLNTNTDTLLKVLRALPEAHKRVTSAVSHGNFFNFYLCQVEAVTALPSGAKVRTPVVRSQVERCN